MVFFETAVKVEYTPVLAIFSHPPVDLSFSASYLHLVLICQKQDHPLPFYAFVFPQDENRTLSLGTDLPNHLLEDLLLLSTAEQRCVDRDEKNVDGGVKKKQKKMMSMMKIWKRKSA